MTLSDLNLERLFQHMVRMQAQLHNRTTMKSLLDQARADTPVIDEILGQIAAMIHTKSLRHRKKSLELAQHHPHLFLALRDIEHEQRDQAELRIRAAMN